MQEICPDDIWCNALINRKGGKKKVWRHSRWNDHLERLVKKTISTRARRSQRYLTNTSRSLIKLNQIVLSPTMSIIVFRIPTMKQPQKMLLDYWELSPRTLPRKAFFFILKWQSTVTPANKNRFWNWKLSSTFNKDTASHQQDLF